MLNCQAKSSTEDRKLRREFDFENGFVAVEAVVEPGQSVDTITQRLNKAVNEAVKETESSLSQKDSVLIKASSRLANKGINIRDGGQTHHTTPILDGIVGSHDASKAMRSGPQKRAGKKQNQTVLYYKIPFTSGHYSKLAKRYAEPVVVNASKHGVPASLVLAVMQTESAFNPRARSHIPAYGLMQLVPKSGAMDSYRHLFGEKKLLGPDYLYNPVKNVELGAGYLSLVYNKYLSSINDPVSRWHCKKVNMDMMPYFNQYLLYVNASLMEFVAFTPLEPHLTNLL